MSSISGWIAYFLGFFSGSTTTSKPASPPAAPPAEPPRCRYRLDNDSSDTVILPDGRKLGYAQYGKLTGRPIFYLHGIPGSRLEGAYWEEAALKLGARIIAADRPGHGWSSPHPSRTLLDHPKDLEYLAEQLNLTEYSVMGISGGGPYAIACAKALPPEKLKCVAIICGLGPPDIGMKGADFIHWIGFTIGWRYSPAIFMRWFLQSDPGGRLDLTDEKRLEILQQRLSKSEKTAHEKDLQLWRDEDFLRTSLRSSREALSQGFDGVLLDGKLMCMDFGFRVEDIRPELPVQLWYAKHDTSVPLNHGEQLAARLGERAQLRVKDETHASLPFNWIEEILKDILKCM